MRRLPARGISAACVILLLCATIFSFAACAPTEKSISGFSMGASFYVEYLSDKDLSLEIKTLLNEVESLYSTTFSDSYVAKLNAANANEKISLSADSYAAFSRVFSLSEKSDGTFDPAVFPLVKAWGFDPVSQASTETRVPPSAETISAVKAHSGLSFFSLDASDLSVKKTDSSALLDFGGAMKGYAAESLRDCLIKKEAASALVNVGGTIAAVGKDCAIGVTCPRESAEKYAFSFLLKSGEICATSGDYERYFECDGVRYHHIIDPSTGSPAKSDVISATVVSFDGMQADAFATAAVVMGSERALALFAECGVRAALITTNKRIITYDLDVLKIKDASYVLAD